MKVLTRYILREFIRSFVISISIIYTILLIQLMIKLLDKFLGKGFDSIFLLKLLFYNTAWIIAMAIPMAVLVASILTYGKLSSENEVVGFKSTGIRVLEIIKPSLITSVFIAIITIYFSCNILPIMNYKARQLNHELTKKRPDVEFEENIYSDLIPNHIMKFKTRDKENKSKFYDIIIHQVFNNRLNRTVIADSVLLNSNDENIMFNLFDGTIHERISVNDEYRQINFKNYKLSVPIDKTNNRKIKYVRGDRELTLAMLNHNIDSLKNKISFLKNKINKRLNLFDIDTNNVNLSNLLAEIDQKNIDSLNKIDNQDQEKIYNVKAKANKTIVSGYLTNIERSINKINKNTVEIHKKFSIPIASIIFLLIGAPLGIKMQRGNMAVSMSISLMFFILYYILIVGGEQLADKNMFNPLLSMWLPNLIVLGFGLIILRYKK
tara:strand:- start:1287 stop:2594 length:1308 start_codon:yes stop_codon:yes gene_type:complete